MISIKKEKHLTLIKTLLIILFILSAFYGLKYVYLTFLNKNKIEALKTQINLQKKSNEDYLNKIKQLDEKKKDTLASYPSTKELETRLNKIFKRVSILDYKLELLGTKKICIDRHVLISRLEAKTLQDQKAALSILNYLGTTKQSTKDENIYFVDYIANKKVQK